MEVLTFTNHTYNEQADVEYEQYPTSEEGDCVAMVNALTKRLETELRAAKQTHLDCGEVLLPCGLLQRVAYEILAMAECEPCGLRGCTLYLNFEGDSNARRALCTIRCDPYTTSTFELSLTLKQNLSSWNSFLPQFIKKMTRRGTIMISPEFALIKNKLYRSYSE